MASRYTNDYWLTASSSALWQVDMNGVPIRIEARDDDEPNTQNSRVLYSLQGENSDLFNIDFDTGIVTVARGEPHTTARVYNRYKLTHEVCPSSKTPVAEYWKVEL